MRHRWTDGDAKRLCAVIGPPSHGAHLALQAQAQMLLAADNGLIDADAQAAVPRREGRRHDLLDPDHVAEQPKVVHPPCELAAAQGVICSRPEADRLVTAAAAASAQGWPLL